jgi:peptidoglycan/LPS O-acetylase OafA/YrhL
MRIIPIYWLLSLVALGAFLISPNLINSSGGKTNLIASFLLLPTHDKYLIQNGWSLRYEFLFYFIFAITLISFKKARHLYTTCAILLILALIGSILKNKSPLSDFLFTEFFCEFVLGMLAYNFFSKARNFGLGVASLLLVFGIILLAVATPLMGEGYSRVFVWGLPMFLIFSAVRGVENKIQTHQYSQPIKLLSQTGAFSYSLYLIHPFTLVVAAITLKTLGLTGNGLFFGSFLIVLAFATGWIFHLYIEQPLNRVTKIILSKI